MAFPPTWKCLQPALCIQSMGPRIMQNKSFLWQEHPCRFIMQLGFGGSIDRRGSTGRDEPSPIHSCLSIPMSDVMMWERSHHAELPGWGRDSIAHQHTAWLHLLSAALPWFGKGQRETIELHSSWKAKFCQCPRKWHLNPLFIHPASE